MIDIATPRLFRNRCAPAYNFSDTFLGRAIVPLRA
jgi:hypothetical protein